VATIYNRGESMMKILIAILIWLALPLIVEFDYRVFNKMANQHLTRKDYIITSAAELIAFDMGIIVGII
jgi:hypothetical protein